MPQTKHFINSTYLSNNLLLNVWHVPSDTSLTYNYINVYLIEPVVQQQDPGSSSSTDSYIHKRYFGP